MRTGKTTADDLKGCSTMADPAYLVQMQFELKASHDVCTSDYFVPPRLVVAADCGSDAVENYYQMITTYASITMRIKCSA
jgi:hypothetical protein